MRKYIVEDYSKYGDVFQTVCDTLEDANAEAKSQWNYLTRWEKKNRRIFVGHVEDNEKYLPDWAFEDGEIDWASYHDMDIEEGYFDSDKLERSE